METLGRAGYLQRIAERFEEARADAAAGYMIIVTGLGGIGKSALAEAARAQHREIVVVDPADDLDDRALFEQALGRPGTLTLVVQRASPSAALRLHPDWLSRGRVLAVEGLDETSARTLLERRGVPPDLADQLTPRFGGHPLTLILAAEAIARAPSRSAAEGLPGVLYELLDVVLGGLPDPIQRLVIELAAVLPRVDVPTLRQLAGLLPDLIGGDDLAARWDWLARRPYVRARPDGVELHDTVRELVVSDLLWRDAERLGRLYRGAILLADGWRRSGSSRSRAQSFQLLEYLNRHHPMNKAMFVGGTSGHYRWRPAGPEDLPLLSAQVARHEGPQAAAALARWLPVARFAEVLLELGPDGERVAGFAMPLSLSELAEHPEIPPDPVTEALIAFVRRRGAGPREDIMLLRWMFAIEGHQLPGPAVTEVLLRTSRATLQVWPVYSAVALSAGEAWRDYVLQIGYSIDDEGVTVDGVHHTLMVAPWLGLETFSWLWTPDAWWGGEPLGDLVVKAGGLTLYLGPHAAWFGTGPERADIQGRAVLRRILQALVHSHRASPGVMVTAEALMRAGWPNERPVKSRLHVAISTLRKLGLEPALESSGGAYRLAPDVRVIDELEWTNAVATRAPRRDVPA